MKKELLIGAGMALVALALGCGQISHFSGPEPKPIQTPTSGLTTVAPRVTQTPAAESASTPAPAPTTVSSSVVKRIPTPTPTATLPPTPQPGPSAGEIVFNSTRDGNSEIYIMSADGSGQTRLTYDRAFDWCPAWSPDGKSIAFTSDRHGNGEIYVMSADGSSQTRLTNNPASDLNPRWSPDGREILFDSAVDGNRDIYLMNADGSNRRRLTTHRSMDWCPAWSPDGTSIAFASMRDGNAEIYVMDADGSNKTRLTDNRAFDSFPAWSPDGGSIAFVSTRDGNSEIYVMSADGSGQTRLTSNLVIDSDPRWSPDGRAIVFDSIVEGNRDIYVMNSDGSNQRRLTHHQSIDSYPAWSPDGWIAPHRMARASHYYQGRTITIVSPTVPGGSNDLWARLVAKHIGKYIPGDPDVLVRNMPGGDGQAGTTYAYQARPNGLTLLNGSASSLRSFKLGEKGIRFNPGEAPVIMMHPSSTVVVIKSGIVKGPKDIRQAKGLIFGSVSPLGAIEFILTKELLGIKTDRMAFGYRSAADAKRALLAGNINMTQDALPSYLTSMQPLVEKGDYIALCQSGVLDGKGNVVRDPLLPDIPTAAEVYRQVYGKSPSGSVWEAYNSLAAGRDTDCVLQVTPGTPDDVIDVLREAARNVVHDGKFLAESKSLVGENPYLVGEEAAKSFREDMRMKPEVLQWVRALLRKGYGMEF